METILLILLAITVINHGIGWLLDHSWEDALPVVCGGVLLYGVFIA